HFRDGGILRGFWYIYINRFIVDIHLRLDPRLVNLEGELRDHWRHLRPPRGASRAAPGRHRKADARCLLGEEFERLLLIMADIDAGDDLAGLRRARLRVRAPKRFRADQMDCGFAVVAEVTLQEQPARALQQGL